MIIEYRGQNDGLNDEASLETGLDCTPGQAGPYPDEPLGEFVARQEFKDEADINNLMRRFGVETRPLIFGEMDFSLDLQTAMASAMTAADTYNRIKANLTDALRAKYPTWQDMMLNPVAFRQDIEAAQAAAKAATPPPGT